MLWSIIVGGIIGWLAGKLMGSRGGVLRNIILGIVGSGVGNWLAGAVGLVARNSLGSCLIGLGGACVVLLICRWLFKETEEYIKKRPLPVGRGHFFQQNLIFLLHFLLKCAILLAINVRRMAVGPCFFPCFVTV